MKKTIYFVSLLALLMTACKTKIQDSHEVAAVPEDSGIPVPYVIPEPAIPFSAEQKSWISQAYRHEKNGWIFLHVEGSPAARGFQHGYLLSKEIRQGIKAMETAWKNQTAMDWSWYLAKADEILTPKTEPENIDEMKGIVEGMKAAGDSATFEEIIGYNGSIELMGYWWPQVKDSYHNSSPEPAKQSCSSFIATGKMTADGGIVLGHNTHTTYTEPYCNVIMDLLPDKGHRILMQSVPGFIHSGTDFFITNAGIVGSETTIGDFYPFDPDGIPEFSRMRTATQYAASIEEWCEIMKKGNNGGYANAWLIGDVNTNEIAWLELGLRYVGFEKKTDGFFIGSNIAEDPRILRFETRMSDNTNIKNNAVSRRVRWKQLMKEYAGKIDTRQAESFEADHFDTYLNEERPGYRTLCAHGEIDANAEGTWEPFRPFGAIDGKVVDSKMAKQMSFVARWGTACGMAFDAKKFLEQHPQYDWQEGILQDRPSEPWTVFTAGEK